MATIKVQGMPSEKFSHNGGDARFAALEKEVDVIVHKNPGINRAFSVLDDLAESFEEARFIFFVPKDVRFVDTPYHDVVHGTGNV